MNVFEAKKALNDFLHEHPDLKPFQKDIRRRLDRAGSSHNRMVLLHDMMMHNVWRLSEVVGDLQETCAKVLK